jgi:hypothetical protein
MKTTRLKDSPFANTYGGLVLVVAEDGQHYLEMQDCFGPSYYGPLSTEQLAAFHVLADVPDAPFV